ncbi:MAG: alkaline phosphatase [Acutalibacteraceae bacterium]|nr:alkaline phosphatase [Acutalibacteraceae bacterium]
MPNRGYAVTDSLSAGATDSAASATALATGSKTHNGYLGMLGANATLKNASEVAREQGKRVGIVTTDPLSGATPAGFSVHTDADVRVFGLGYGTEIFKGKTVDNTDIGKFLIAAIKGKTYKI